MNLYQKIVKIMSEIQSLKKDGNVSFKSTNYNYLSESKTTSIFHEKFVENNIMVFPIKAEETKTGQVTHGHYTFRMVNAENPEEFIDIQSTGQGQDSSDKGSGKAQSYAFKYALWRTFAIPSNDDPDQISSAEHAENKRKQDEAANKPITEDQLNELETLMMGVDINLVAFKNYFKISNVSDLKASQFNKAMAMVKKKAEGN